MARFSPARRDALILLVGFALLVAPLWVPALHLGDPTHRYERVEVTTSNGTVSLAGEDPDRDAYPISEEIACTDDHIDGSRACYFERHLAANHSVPTRWMTDDPGEVYLSPIEAHRYVQLEDGVYETTYAANESPGPGGLYRVELALERVAPEDALRHGSVEPDRVPGAVWRAATSGEATARHEVAVPERPVRLDNESYTYYRVYHAGETAAPWYLRTLASLLTYLGPAVWLVTTVALYDRFGVEYVGPE